MTIALFWVGAALVVVAIIGLALEFIRSAGTAGGLTERAVRAGMAPRTGNVSPSSPQVPPVADAPSRAVSSPPERAGATTSPPPIKPLPDSVMVPENKREGQA